MAMKEFYEESSVKLAGMQKRLKARGVHSEEAPTMQMPLVAPITGQIVEHESIEGEHVEALEEIYEIVNLERVWIVARISEFDLNELPGTPNASLELPSFAGRSFDVLALGGRLVNIGTRVDEQTRTVPIRFEIPNPEGLFRAGMFTNVYLETKRSVDCLAVPEKAIVLDNGRPLVYVMLEGETFQRREVELGVRDQGWVEVKAGLLAGERVATRSAYAIKLASLSPASFGHGHGH
jgi:RND family efflux transporter MFP subunit